MTKERPPGRRGPEPERDVSWERLRTVFAALLEQPPAERRAWLIARTDLDESLRREAASLLEAHERAGNFLNPEDIPRRGFLEESNEKGGRRPR